MKKSTSVVLEGIKTIAVRDFEVPHIGPKEALLRMELAGVCSSDVGMYTGKIGPKPYPIILGHELVGFIEEAGEDFTHRHGVKKGDRVIVEFTFGCSECSACVAGNYRFCEKTLSYGSSISCQEPPHLWGGYGQYLYLPYNVMVHKISSTLSAKTAVLVCAVMANAIRWVRLAGNVAIGDTVVVQGVGQQGLAAIAVARYAGAKTVIATGLGKDSRRFEMAKRMGADYCINVEEKDMVAEISSITGGKMAELVIELTGNAKSAELTTKLVGRMGAIVLPGLYGTGKDVPIKLDELIRKEARIYGVYSHDGNAVRRAIGLAESGRFPWDDMVTHVFRLEEAEKAIKVVAGEVEGSEAVKVVIDPWL
ncbi:MAG: alcohol dehydrogenase catalytic domain-containing protein [Dethiobacter sp.]|jgi:alcohol dehydrogenase|nr:alcohol dehydrogenase catalytic domain-containing protein [Dethiobacter sp.]